MILAPGLRFSYILQLYAAYRCRHVLGQRILKTFADPSDLDQLEMLHLPTPIL